jgi:hypothetical protein
MVALVDDEDFDAVSAGGKWYAKPRHRTFYAARNHWLNGKSIHVQMHGLITGLNFVDHANGDGLDNRRVNLRVADRSQNMMNRAMNLNNKSGFKGVHKDKTRWRAGIQVDRRRISLGGFATPEEAARAYDVAALHYFAEFARPNFPQEIGA